MKSRIASLFCWVGVLLHSSFGLAQEQLPFVSSQPTLVATLQAQDKVAANRQTVTPQFYLQSLSRNGSHLFVSRNEIGEHVDAGDYIRFVDHFLQDVDLGTGATSNIARVQGNFQWFDDVPGAMAAVDVKIEPVPDKKLPQITLGTPTNEPPPQDGVPETLPQNINGKAVYVPFVRVSGSGATSQWRRFLVFRRVENGKSRVQTFPVEAQGYDVFGPQWSPDGQTVLLKVGMTGDRYDTYRIHFWNPTTGRLWQGPSDQISFLRPQFSPDSQEVAYVVGGDISGFVDRADPVSLRVYNLKTRQSKTLASAVPTVGTPADFHWQNNTTILYTQPRVINRDTPARARRPDVYQVSVQDAKPELLLREAFGAVPSPDGKRIAFFGWLAAKEEEDEQKRDAKSRTLGARLFLFDLATGKRELVRPNIFATGTQIRWTPDSQKLVLLQARYNTQKALGTASVSVLTLGQHREEKHLAR